MSFKHIILIFLILIFLPSVFADDYKPYLHKASIPQAPKLKLFGQYATNLYPGAATYNFPIEVPKGTNNLQPSVFISYNSQAVKQRAGVLSAGWSLSANDYIYRDINFTVDVSDDNFVLVLNGNTYKLIENGDEYRTEVEYYLKVQKLSGATNELGSYWLLNTKDGTRYRFGYNNDSELVSNTLNNTVAKWSVDEVADTFGNTINYAYSEDPFAEDEGSVYMQEITYNKDERRKITFGYESSVRPDRRKTYEQGSIVEESRRLTDVSVFADNDLVRRYNINYVTLNPALSSISSIKQYGNDNSSVLSTVSFDYYNSEAGFVQTTSLWKPNVLFSDNSHIDYGVRLLDLNNDGYTDVIKGRGSSSEKQAWLNDKNGNWSSSSLYASPEYIVTGDYGTDEGVRFEDVNNDGFVDLLKSKAGTRIVYLNNGTGWASSSFSIPIDFVDSSGNDAGVLIADVNGDGRADIIQAKSGTRAVYLNNGAGWSSSSWSVPVDFYDVWDTGARLVDINGDGLVDILQATSKATPVQKAWLNTGSGWVEYSNWQPPVYFVTSYKPDNGVRFSDVNGDGLIDILEDYANGTSTSKSAWINTGNGWSSDSTWQSPVAFTANDYNIARRLADVNGDGLPDVVVSHHDSSQQYVWLKNSTMPYLLEKITNEYGGVTSVSYTASTQFNNTENGISKIGFNIFVVSNIFTNNS